MLVIRSTHWPLQLVWPVGQTHVVPLQTPPVGQVTQVPLQQVCPVGQSAFSWHCWTHVRVAMSQTGVVPLQQLAPQVVVPLGHSHAQVFGFNCVFGAAQVTCGQTHALLTQVFGEVHVVPQVPQFCTSVAVLAHWLPHLVKPVSHSNPQVPLLQTAWALATVVVQTVPQLPQLLTVFSGVQTPLQQPWPFPHRVPQAPQLLLSLFRSTHVPPHRTCPVGHPDPAAWHTPLWHSCPCGQGFPHRPQFRRSVCKFTHSLLQQLVPAGQHRPSQHWVVHDVGVHPTGAAAASRTPNEPASAPVRAAPSALRAVRREVAVASFLLSSPNW